MSESADIQPIKKINPRTAWAWDAILIGILLMGAFFRFTGVDWDAGQHLHPDERFLTMVETSLQPVKNLSEYFDTSASTLNPHNRGYGFYVYGTLPIFIVRYVAEWTEMSGYGEVYLVGRALSGAADLATVLLTYLIARKLFRNPRPALLAAAFMAFAVLPIQLSHYFTVDTFTNLFGFLTFYFAVRVMRAAPGLNEDDARPWNELALKWWKGAADYVWFGVALGMAVACKVNAAVLAMLLPMGALVYYEGLPLEKRERVLPALLRNLVIGAVAAVILFRVFQPYAFSGPTFFNVSLNPKWVDNMTELANQSTGDVDFPPALQWARRPLSFAWTNMVVWGLGLPLGLLAWGGFLWMGWKILRGKWRAYLLLWGWTGVYFAWQSWNWTRSMRYQMLVYPALAIIAAWAIFALWEKGRAEGKRWLRFSASALGFIALVGTFLWAFAFVQIYMRPVTRVAASEWIYDNVPGPVTLKLSQGGEEVNHPLSFLQGTGITQQTPAVIAFTPRSDSLLTGVYLAHLADSVDGLSSKTVHVVVQDDQGAVVTEGSLIAEFSTANDARGLAYTVPLDVPTRLDPARQYLLTLTVQEDAHQLNLAGGWALVYLADDATSRQQALPDPVDGLSAGEIYSTVFTLKSDATLRSVYLPHVVDWQALPNIKRLHYEIIDLTADPNTPLWSGTVEDDFSPGQDARGDAYTLAVEQPIQLTQGHNYTLTLKNETGPGFLALYGSKHVNETSWDDALPLGLDLYNPYDYTTGIYRTDLNFEMYWDDNAEKLERFVGNLDQADYIFITSNRQWGTTVRVPERYPMTSMYYRNLLGCPPDQDIVWCYSVADVGMFEGKLGFELAAVFQSDPNLGPVRFNSQFAEEAFTVYDAPKVMIFRKTDAYDATAVREQFEAVDLSTVVRLTPRKAGSHPGNLMLPTDRLARQLTGGTWSELFNRGDWLNQWPALGALAWYGLIGLLGVISYPLTRLAFAGLKDKGYAYARLAGLLVLTWGVWMAGSNGIPFERWTIWCGVGLLLAVNLWLAWVYRREIGAELRDNWKQILTVEAIFLAFFLAFLLVRVGNPDLWHPYKGGEKPMDFSYFNAVLKSTSFPPYDPWFSGGYINYYYYGFVISGILVKALGILPATAYNLILPTWYAFLAVGAYSFVWNLLRRNRPVNEPDLRASVGGGAAALAVAVFGNLGTVRMIWHGLQKLAAPGGSIDGADFFTRMGWTFEGLAKYFTGARLPFPPGDWYWIPSRAIPGEPITEFPMFTFFYADPHAHLFALPITVLALGWVAGVVLQERTEESGWRAWLRALAALFAGGVIVGALRPTNTWDFPTYLAIAAIGVAYSAWMGWPFIHSLDRAGRVARAAAATLVLVGLSFALYQPFANWFGQAYSAVDPFSGERTPFWSYVTHWGVFLAVIAVWLFWEAVDWMAHTPVSALRKLKPYFGWIYLAAGLLAAAIVVLTFMKIQIAWVALLLGALAGVLLLRPDQPASKRLVLFMVGTGLVLTLAVELIVLRGDIGRMNTVFKFYLQAWVLLGASAAAGYAWLLEPAARLWRPFWRNAWQWGLTLLMAGALLFPVMGGLDKITDRVSAVAPHGLDGMAYMATAAYTEGEKVMDLSEDYRAIQWMQENVTGSPVIVEGQVGEYRWGARYSIYTGLPGVVGWNWHQRQQRAYASSEWVWNRVNTVNEFYNSMDLDAARQFLQRYQVKYVVVGQLERAVYPEAALDRFAGWEGKLWKVVYQEGETTLYEVLDPLPESEALTYVD